MLSDSSAWAMLAVAVCIVWGSQHIAKVVHAANLDRRDDHRELMATLGEMACNIASIDLLVGGISNAVDPPLDNVTELFGPLMKPSKV